MAAAFEIGLSSLRPNAPRDHVAQKLRKVARAFLEGQRDACEVGFLDACKPILDHGRDFTFKNVRHALNCGEEMGH
jgi:hypothetical protein